MNKLAVVALTELACDLAVAGRIWRWLSAAFDGLTPGLRGLVAVWAASVALALFVIAASPRFAHIDFVAFSCAGHAVAQRDDPYRELPLQRCEHAVTSEGVFATSVAVPAPLPPFALLPFAALSWFDFPVAFALFTAASALATAFGCVLCARLARVPTLLVIALAAPLVWDNWMKGQPVPFAFLALTGAALLLAGGRDRWAAVAALGTLLQPQFGLAVCGALFLWRPRARVPLAIGAAVLAIACVAAVSPATLVDYVRHVLPLQAGSEARWASQLSLVNPLVVLGVPVARAMTIAAVQQAVTMVIGVLLAGYLARKNGAVELVVVFPALCAAIGGTYLHVNALLVVLPAALVIARAIGGRAVYVALGAALLPWLALGEAIPIPAIVVSFSVFTIAFVLGVRWPLALAASAGCAVLALAARFVERDAPAVHGIIPVVGRAYAETSWAAFTAAMNPAEPVLRAALILKSATWLGLVALLVCAVLTVRLKQRRRLVGSAEGAEEAIVGRPRSTSFVRSAFLQLAGGTAVAGFSGCGAGGSSTAAVAGVPTGAPATPTPSAAPAGPAQTATLTVVRSTAGAVPAALAGLSYEKNKLSSGFFNGQNASLIGCFTRLGTSILRIGGNSVDQTTWTPGGGGGVTGQVAPADIAGLAAFLQAAGWHVIYGINLASNTPALAAAEAAAAAQALGSSLYGFEIGNECDLYHENGLRPTTYAFADFVTEWSTYAAAIRQAVPNAPLTGPASAGSVGTWTVPFAASEAATIRLLTQHYYRANGADASSTIALLLAADPNLPGELAQLQSAATANAIPNGYRLAEANSFYNGGAPNVSDAYGTALWAIDFLLINAQNGSAGVNFHGGGNGTGYTPIADAGGAVVEVRPEYYGMLFVAQIPPGPMYGVNVSSSLLLTAYAIAGANGSTTVVIVNKDATNTATTTIALGGTGSRAVPLALLGTGLNATGGTTLGGTSVGSNGSWSPATAAPIVVSGTTLTVNVAPASALLLAVS